MRRMRLAIADGGFPAFREAFYRHQQEQQGDLSGGVELPGEARAS
jgi:hypothetical protein